jgi:hypothetical protein
MLEWDWYGIHKKCIGTCYAEIVFLHLLWFAGHVVHSGVSVASNNDALFFLLRWAQCCFHKKRAAICYAELVFFYLVQSVGHVMHCGASGAWNVDALFFMLWWAQCGFHKKQYRTPKLMFLHSVEICGSNTALCCDQAAKTSMHYFSCSGGAGMDSTNSVLGHVMPKLCFSF